MKTVIIFLPLCFLFFASCKPDKTQETNYDIATSYILKNISYGSNSQQVMDIYLPANRSDTTTKVFVLIHGGGWSAGDKADYTDMFNSLKTYYPDHAIINLNYRLGTSSNPGYPKQIEDIQSALSLIQLPKYNLSKRYLLFGGSAGAHLSMLYAYAFDDNHYVKGVINTVGPADMTDTAYLNHAVFLGIFASFIGNAAYSYEQNTALFEAVSPTKRVSTSAPPTLSFYGDQDQLIPSTQLGLLRNALDAKGIYHVDTMYVGAGHANFNAEQSQDYLNKIIAFINQYFQ